MNNSQPAEAAMRAAIQTLYSTFASYALRPHVDGCPCCVTDNLENQIHSTTLRKLSPLDLGEFGRKAMTTWGEVEDFKHFLPRLFEIKTFSPRRHTDSEVLFGKLDYGNWHGWPIEEQTAVREFLHAFWSYSLTVTAHDWNIEQRLCSIAQTGEDLTPFLSHWTNHLSPTALMHLIGLVCDNANQLTLNGNLSNSFWSEHKKEMQKVIAWIINPGTAKAFEEAILNEPPTDIDSAEMESALIFFGRKHCGTGQ